MADRPIPFSAPMVRALLAGTKTQTRRVVKPVGGDDSFVLQDYGRGWWPYRSDDGETPMKGDNEIPHACPYGQPGDQLWVREAWRVGAKYDATKPADIAPRSCSVLYAAGGSAANDSDGWKFDQAWPGDTPVPWAGKLRPGMFMPRWASRITLDVTGVRVERLQAISNADARAEGIAELVPASKRAEGLTPAALAFAAAATVDKMPRTTRRGFLAGALASALGFAASPSRPWEVLPQRMTQAPSPQQLYALLWESINGPGSWDTNPWVWVVEFRRAQP